MGIEAWRGMKMIRIGDAYIERVKINDPERVIKNVGSELQVVSVECWRAVAFATILTLRAFERGTNHAKTPGGELLLRLAGTLQIKDAIESVGVKRGLNYAVAFGERALERLKKLELEGAPLTDCDDEEAKTFFEKSALVEVL
jgi:KEOPS complex subunit Cgi121